MKNAFLPEVQLKSVTARNLIKDNSAADFADKINPFPGKSAYPPPDFFHNLTASQKTKLQNEKIQPTINYQLSTINDLPCR